MEQNKKVETTEQDVIVTMREKVLREIEEGKLWKCGTPKRKEKIRQQQEDSQKEK